MHLSILIICETRTKYQNCLEDSANVDSTLFFLRFLSLLFATDYRVIQNFSARSWMAQLIDFCRVCAPYLKLYQELRKPIAWLCSLWSIFIFRSLRYVTSLLWWWLYTLLLIYIDWCSAINRRSPNFSITTRMFGWTQMLSPSSYAGHSKFLFWRSDCNLWRFKLASRGVCKTLGRDWAVHAEFNWNWSVPTTVDCLLSTQTEMFGALGARREPTRHSSVTSEINLTFPDSEARLNVKNEEWWT